MWKSAAKWNVSSQQCNTALGVFGLQCWCAVRCACRGNMIPPWKAYASPRGLRDAKAAERPPELRGGTATRGTACACWAAAWSEVRPSPHSAVLNALIAALAADCGKRCSSCVAMAANAYPSADAHAHLTRAARLSHVYVARAQRDVSSLVTGLHAIKARSEVKQCAFRVQQPR